jgi:hypothetical protein
MSHQRSGAPNQDFGRAVLLSHGSGVVLAVADGHGDPLYSRSDRGSRFAVEAAIEILTKWIRVTAGSETSIRSAAEKLPQRLLDAWRAHVAADLESDPPGPDSSDTSLVEQSPELLYGSTLVAAVIDERLALYAQIGDGDLLFVTPDGAVKRAVPGRDDLPRSMTESLCQPDANDRFRVQVEFFATTPRPALVMASTDGYCNSFRDDAAFLKVARDLSTYLEDKGPDWIAKHLEGWLEETSRSGSGDDITLALAWFGREGQIAGMQDGLKKRRPWRLLVVAAVLLLFLPVGWAAWTWAPAGWKDSTVAIWHTLKDKALSLLENKLEPSEKGEQIEPEVAPSGPATVPPDQSGRGDHEPASEPGAEPPGQPAPPDP